MGREKNAPVFNTKRSLALSRNTQKHVNTIHNREALTLPPAVRRRREVSGGVKRRDGRGEGGGVNYSANNGGAREGEEKPKDRCSVISTRPGGGSGGGCRWWR